MRTEWASIRYRLSRIIEALQWKIPLWALFVYAVVVFFVPPLYMLLILLVIAYARSWYRPEREIACDVQ